MVVAGFLARLLTSWLAGIAYAVLGIPLGLLLSVGPVSLRTGLAVGSLIAIVGLVLIARPIVTSWSQGFACLGISGILVGLSVACGIFFGSVNDSAHQGRLVFFWALMAAVAFFIASPAVGALNIRRHARVSTGRATTTSIADGG